MPALPNARHEAVAVAMLTGKSQVEAYTGAGYKPNRSHAARLVAKGDIQARVAELQAEAVAKATDKLSFEAVDLFTRLEQRIEAAAEAGDHKTAVDGTKFMISCFGYQDSPTLTHEHVRGENLNNSEEGAQEQERPKANVQRFGPILAKLREHRSMSSAL